MNDDKNFSSDSSMYDRMVGHLGDFMSSVMSEEGESKETSLYRKLESLKNRYGEPRLIAHGGMKEIFEVEDKSTGRPVAMAVIKNLKSRELIEQFIQEARITARLEHPNIMPVYDIGIEESGQAFFTMKLVTADNLGFILKSLKKRNKEYQERYPLNRLLEIFCDICDAVAFAHSKGVLHLDLKPDNIQVGDFGEVLVCDWGLSRFKPEMLEKEEQTIEYKNGQMTIHGQVYGSPGFMSPEQASKDRNELTSSSDIYSLGCILYAMLTLNAPFNGESVTEILDKTADGDFLSPEEMSSSRFIPEALSAVSKHAMAFDPDDRYTSALELKSDIRSFISGYATFAEKAGLWTRFVLFYRRQRALVCLLVVLILSGGIFAVTYSKSAKEKEKVEEQLDEQEKATKKVAQALDLTNAKNEKLLQSVEIIRKKINIFNNINIYRGLNNLADRNFSEAAQNFIDCEDESFLAYVQICQKLGDNYQDRAMPRYLLYELISLLNDDLYTALIQRLLVAEKDFLTQEELVPLAEDLLKMTNPECGSINLAVQTLFERTSLSLAGYEALQNISPLVLVPAQYVDLSGTAVSDISALANLPLVSLNLRSTQVKDISFLKDLPLRSLDLSYSRVKDFSILDELNLTRIKLAGLKPEYEKMSNGLKNVKELFVSITDKKPKGLPEGCLLIQEEHQK